MTFSNEHNVSSAQPKEIEDIDGAISILGGAMLTYFGLRRGGITGTLGTFLGSALLLRGMRGHPLGDDSTMSSRSDQGDRPVLSAPSRKVTSDAHIVVSRQPQEVYRYWRDLTNSPSFMSHIERVDVKDDKRSHWVGKDANGQTMEWDFEITEDKANERIAWRSVGDTASKTSGWVEFKANPAGDGTEIKTSLTQDTVKQTPSTPSNAILQEALNRFKHVIEGKSDFSQDTNMPEKSFKKNQM